MLQPAAAAGVNTEVLGEAWKNEADGAFTPSDIGFVVFQTYLVVSADPPPKPMTRAVEDVGMTTQSWDPVMVPRSRFQRPPGVLG